MHPGDLIPLITNSSSRDPIFWSRLNSRSYEESGVGLVRLTCHRLTWSNCSTIPWSRLIRGLGGIRTREAYLSLGSRGKTGAGVGVGDGLGSGTATAAARLADRAARARRVERRFISCVVVVWLCGGGEVGCRVVSLEKCVCQWKICEVSS